MSYKQSANFVQYIIASFLFPGRDDFLPVSKRPRHSLYPMLEVDKALEITLSKACRKSTQDIVLANGNNYYAIFYNLISNNFSFFACVYVVT